MMLKTLWAFRGNVSLIPDSGVQFLDFGFNVRDTNRLTRFFHERPSLGQDDQMRQLVPVVEDEESGQLVDPDSGTAYDHDDCYPINARQALDPYVGHWLPVPYLRVQGRDGDQTIYDGGPTNWVRVRVIELEQPDRHGNTHRVTMVVDTTVGEHTGDSYVLPTRDDATAEDPFHLVCEFKSNSWWLREGWIKDWLDELFNAHQQRRGSRISEEEEGRACEQWARFMVFLDILRATVRLPALRFTDTFTEPAPNPPIPVDLVLDIGNSRTCGILVEQPLRDSLNLGDSSVLELRDIGMPEFAYNHPFQSQLQFARANFGNEFLSRRSGRARAFHWPSIVRTGPEASRLAGNAEGAEGWTGLSSPKRYLWDTRPNEQVWRFNAAAGDATRGSIPVYGPIMTMVTQEGEVIATQKTPGTPAMLPKFSKSSLYTFMLVEIILQAICRINAPDFRQQRGNQDVARRLRRIILTIPTATPIPERALLNQRCEAAVALVMESLGWKTGKDGGSEEPEISISFDEATCTQIVYLYSEIAEKFQRSAHEFFTIMGRHNAGRGTSTMRVASLDIGGGTMDLMVMTYESSTTGSEDGAAGAIRRAIVPTQNFREGFRIAGDDILEAIVSRHVLPALEADLKAHGVDTANAFLRSVFGSDRGDQSVEERHFRMLLVNQVLVPVALAVIAEYEKVQQFTEEPPKLLRAATVLDGAHDAVRALIARFEKLAAEQGAVEYSFANLEVAVDGDTLGKIVESVIGQVLGDLCEVIHRLDCDVLLLTGRPSRMPAVLEIILAYAPVPIHRIIPMHRYRTGPWYPFRGVQDWIDDPKTTVAVGALLCRMAIDRQLPGFSIIEKGLAMHATDRFIGEMEREKIIRNDRVLFVTRNGADDDEDEDNLDEVRTLEFDEPIFIGSRQLPVERWPATPLYFLAIGSDEVVKRRKLPLRVTLRRMGKKQSSRGNNLIELDEVVDAEETSVPRGQMLLRLQTMISEDHWLDSGSLLF